MRLRRRREVGVHRSKEKGHEFTAEYFTIHPKTLLSALSSEDAGNNTAKAEQLRLLREKSDQRDDEADDQLFPIEDIASLVHHLRRSAVDREKLSYVRRFVDAGAADLYYLPLRMGEIMSLFIYQSSRRQLLADLLVHHDRVRERRRSLAGHSHTHSSTSGDNDDEGRDAQAEHERAERAAKDLLEAIHAADQQVKRLEYWSDIKGMASEGDLLQQEGGWDRKRWQGLGQGDEGGFRNLQDAGEEAPGLRRGAEHGAGSGSGTGARTSAGVGVGAGAGVGAGVGAGAGEEEEDDDAQTPVTAPSHRSKKSTASGPSASDSTGASRVLAVKYPASGAGKAGSMETETEAEGYVTAFESASDIPHSASGAGGHGGGKSRWNVGRGKGKGKGKEKAVERGGSRVGKLDGVAEDESDAEANADADSEKEEAELAADTTVQPNIPFHIDNSPKNTRLRPQRSVQIVEPVPLAAESESKLKDRDPAILTSGSGRKSVEGDESS